MADPQATVLPLGNATVELQRVDDVGRFRVHSAILTPLPARRRIRLRFEGPEGSVDIEIPRVAFWRLTNLFHERSIAADDPGPKTSAPGRTRRRRS